MTDTRTALEKARAIIEEAHLSSNLSRYRNSKRFSMLNHC